MSQIHTKIIFVEKLQRFFFPLVKCLQIDALSEYRECAPCPKVCPGQEPVSCDKSCKPGCICIENTVLNTDINKCMWNKACPVPNGNETPKPNQRARFGRRYSRN